MAKITKCYIYNNISKTITIKEFNSLKSAKSFETSENRYNRINNIKHEFCSLHFFENIYKN